MKKEKSAVGKVVVCTFILLMVCSMLGGLLGTAMAASKFNIGDTVEVTDNLNVRTGPGTGYSEITDPDYPGYAPKGTLGKILSGPSSGDGYIWWKVDFGPGLYSGWSVENYLEKVTPCPHSCWDRSALSGNELAALVRNHFPLGGVTQTGESIRVTAYAVAKAESGGNPSACGDIDIPASGHMSIGLWQINTYWHPNYDRCKLFEPDYNANAAKEISNDGKDWNPWTTWKNGAYKQYLTEARRHFYPKVTSLSLSFTSISLGESVKIYYSVSDDVGLSRVELWRTVDKNGVPDPSPWKEIKRASISGTSYSYYFTDTPTSPGIYWYGIHVVDNSGAPEAWNDEKNSRTGGSPGVFGPIKVEVTSNQVPTLSGGYVTPSSGDTSTTFNYYVTYTDSDGDAPTTKYVYIDGSPHMMTKISGSYASGATFKYSTTLSAGVHNYYFYFNDGHGHTVRLPTSVTYSGPSVSQPNQPPTLSSGYVTPSSGDTSTTFDYYVTYTDSDGDAPTTKYVYVDGSPHMMTKISGSYASGATFKYSTTLSAGVHNYYFYFNDGHGHTKRLPTSGTYSGPSVSLPNQAPTLSSGYVTPSSGDTSTTFNYYVTYTDSDGDAPTTKYVYVDGSPHTLTKISGSYASGATFKYSTTLSVGSHNYYFYFNDGHGHTKRLPTSGTYSGPSVPQPNQPPTLSSSYVTPSSGDTSTTFDYYVTYTDSDGDAPTTKYVYVDGSPHAMTKVSGSYASGAMFKYSTTLPAGSHNYYFYFNDGQGHTVRLPTSGTYSGPSVPPTPPNDVYWLAKAIASEAGSVWDVDHWVRCSDEERSAVGWTVLNRLKSGEHGETIKEVVTEPGQYAYNQEPTLVIRELAKELLEGLIPDLTGGATHFFSPIGMPKEGQENKCKPPIGTGRMDCNGELHQVPGTLKKVYFPSWAKPKEGWTITEFYQTVENLEWVSGLLNVRNYYFMFYRQIKQPYVISSNASGTEKNIFDLSQNVYCYAGNLPASKDVRIYVVNNKDFWSARDTLSDVSDGYETVRTGSDRSISTTQIWGSPLTQGSYDIVVDTNRNGEWNEGEPIDSWTTTGFEAIPEFTTIAIPVAVIIGLMFLFSRRKRKKEEV